MNLLQLLEAAPVQMLNLKGYALTLSSEAHVQLPRSLDGAIAIIKFKSGKQPTISVDRYYSSGDKIKKRIDGYIRDNRKRLIELGRNFMLQATADGPHQNTKGYWSKSYYQYKPISNEQLVKGLLTSYRYFMDRSEHDMHKNMNLLINNLKAAGIDLPEEALAITRSISGVKIEELKKKLQKAEALVARLKAEIEKESKR